MPLKRICASLYRLLLSMHATRSDATGAELQVVSWPARYWAVVLPLIVGCRSLGTNGLTLGAISGAATVVAALPPACRPSVPITRIGIDNIPECGHRKSLIVNEENDTYGGGTDESYTNGFGLKVESGQAGRATRSVLGGLGHWLPMSAQWAKSPDCEALDTLHAACLTSSIGIAQTMYTPSNRYLTSPDTTDRPYAGALQLRYGIRRQSKDDAMEITVSMGVLGPSAQGERTQTWIHKNLAHVPPFEGWHNQIPDQGLLGIELSRRRRYARALTDRLSMDAIPVIGAVAGNWMDYGRVGSQLRLGYGLTPGWTIQRLTETKVAQSGPDARQDASLPPKPAESHYELGLLADGEARAVLYNASLDRTPLTVPSPWSHHSPYVFEGALGILGRIDLSHSRCYGLPDVTVSYRYVWRGREIDGVGLNPTTEAHRYGVLLVGVSRYM